MPGLVSLSGKPLGTPEFVLDPGVPSAWLLGHRWTRYASRVLNKMGQSTAAVPTAWPSGLAEILLDSERRGLVTAHAVSGFLAGFSAFRIGMDAEPPPRTWGDILAVARTHSLSASDAAYLELALRLGLPLATTDAALTRAASAANVPIYTP
jgi:predicted nucleic acid-binding protein